MFFFVDERVIKFLKLLLFFVIGAAIGDTMVRFGYSGTDVVFHGLVFLCAVMIGFNLRNGLQARKDKKKKQ